MPAGLQKSEKLAHELKTAIEEANARSASSALAAAEAEVRAVVAEADTAAASAAAERFMDVATSQGRAIAAEHHLAVLQTGADTEAALAAAFHADALSDLHAYYEAQLTVQRKMRATAESALEVERQHSRRLQVRSTFLPLNMQTLSNL